ncbi:alpha/beta fold hydrolase family protein [Hymenobacter properus]|uniref:Alpha/beta hydrolase n=1 Tax=Hymenobacter properus TaxID=2791026 RepID=A0A931BGD1_9BACT|nr:hypothetical protein [Hymenobacter properus]MBF9141981.1 hypothetical protein [Hymenobacter properus]MBR7720788.1 hypothetical protein [Microvirga sp. SRT04]
MRRTSGVLVWLFTLLSLASAAMAQPVQRQRVQSNDPVDIYRNGKHAGELAYYLMAPAGPPRGVLLLLPGLACPAEGVFKETALAQEAARSGFVVAVPTLNNRLYLDSAGTRLLGQVLNRVAQQYPTAGRNLCLGGFSAGGQLALAYAEQLVRDSVRQTWRVKAVFGVDPPADLANLWQRGQRDIDRNCSALLVRGGQSTLKTLGDAFGGSPEQVPAVYQQYSAFINTSPTGGNLSQLAATPVRVYCEPDMAYWRWHLCATMQLEDLNAVTLRQLVDCLQRQGNTRAEYIETTGKGKLKGRQFPHSWSIVDAPECVQWLQTCLSR